MVLLGSNQQPSPCFPRRRRARIACNGGTRERPIRTVSIIPVRIKAYPRTIGDVPKVCAQDQGDEGSWHELSRHICEPGDR
jgi:hypothetical protein